MMARKGIMKSVQSYFSLLQDETKINVKTSMGINLITVETVKIVQWWSP